MRSHPRVSPRTRQRGWAGIVGILVVLVVVGYLAKDALKKYGLTPAAPIATKAGTPAERARAPAAGGIEALDLGSAPMAPANALERARGVEDMVKQQAAERAARPDGTTQ